METAINALIEHIEKSTKIKFKETSKDYFKEMHKRQIVEAIEYVLEGFIIDKELRYKIAEKYYNNKFSEDITE